MFDGLIAVLMEWLGEAFCWLVEQLVALAIALMKFVSAILPNIEVPDFLDLVWSAQVSSFVAWLFPTGAVFWAVIAFFTYEALHFFLLIIYRAFMDLL